MNQLNIRNLALLAVVASWFIQVGGQLLACPCEKMFQGAIADALGHFGQLTMLRRLAGGPVRAENYAVAEIERGCVGPSQSAKRFEFERENATGRILRTK